MSLIKKIEKMKLQDGMVRITGCLQQFGSGGAILNADINGEQKTTENFIGEVVPKISTECLTNGIFKHRITNLPTAAYKAAASAGDADKKKVKGVKTSSIESLEELFSALKWNRVEYRGGAIMTDGTMNAQKSYRVDESVPYLNNKDYIVVENRRLGVKGDSGENDYPRQQILYKNLRFFVSSYLDLKTFNPNNNKLIKKFLEKVDLLGDSSEEKIFKSEVNSWIDKLYPTKADGDLNLDVIVENLVKEFSSYDHPVHRRYNSFLLMNDIKIEKINTREELEKSLSATKIHYGV